eukprot:1390426-Pleurochrysis_carterae.AAC.2
MHCSQLAPFLQLHDRSRWPLPAPPALPFAALNLGGVPSFCARCSRARAAVPLDVRSLHALRSNALCDARLRRAACAGAMSYGLVAMLHDVVAALWAWVRAMCCTVSCTTTVLKVNSRNLKVVRLLAEGGFSFVYLVEEDGKKCARSRAHTHTRARMRARAQ